MTLMARATSFSSREAKAFQEKARSWVREAVVGIDRIDDSKTDAEIMAARVAWDKKLYEGGFSCLSWPAEYGGGGLGPIEDFLLAEEAWNAGAPEGLAGRVGRNLVGPCIMAYGTPEQKDRFLPSIVSVDHLWCQGFSEPDAGSDLASLRTSAKRDGDAFVINGQKIWSSFSALADWCLLLCRTGDPESRHHNLTMLLVDLNQEGIEVRPIRQISGSSEFSEIFFDNAVAAADCVLGEEGRGWQVAINTLSAERGSSTAIFLGSTEQEFKLLETCDNCRRGLGHGADERLAEFRSRLHATRWQSIRSIEQMASGREANRSYSVLKIAMSELSQELSQAGVESACDTHFAHWRRQYMTTRQQSIGAGTNEINRTVLAERVLNVPR
ncbi:acyl-CoA dehydrogenase family protein [Dactylosporangium sp. NPDC050688]|uniref:acyl-CoA dehydrogenase family protein n=1 Tax=Dactylosporangium sp. NPDC050688 TaxID=3157217 RepID=UPI0033C3D547